MEHAAWDNYWGSAEQPFGEAISDRDAVPEGLRVARVLTLSERLATRLPQVEQLAIENCSMPQLERVARLGSLETLWIGGMTGITTLEPLAALGKLRRLHLGGSTKDASLEPIGRLSTLEALSLRATFSKVLHGGVTKYPSFAPLVRLERLRYLELSGVRAREQGFEPISRLVGLERLDLNERISLDEHAMLAARLPHTQGDFRHPTIRIPLKRIDPPCPVCGTREAVWLNGPAKRGPWSLCVTCHPDQVRAHVAAFDALVAKWAAE